MFKLKYEFEHLPRGDVQIGSSIEGGTVRSQNEIDDGFGRSVRHRRVTIVFSVLAVLLVVLSALNLCIGSLNVPIDEVRAILFGQNPDSTNYQVIWSIRLPRLIAAALLGGALALSGFLLQTFFNNPIAGPFILGISSGAKLVVALVMIVIVGGSGVMTSGMMVASAFIGSLIAMLFVLLVSRRINSMSMLIVAGVMIGYICSAATDFLITFASDANIVNLKNWSLGSFSGVNWNDIGMMTVVVIIASVAVFCMSKPIGAFQLGEQYARSMGVNIRVFRIALILLSSLLAATVTAFAGPISFVGIAVPHIVKRMLGTSKPLVVIPGAFFGGAIFCLFCDLIARSVFAPTEISISAVTAIFGAPVVISILLKREKARR
ncbi:MAG: iron ABC transporter permease [Eggerthellaceae bacterium]|nr:iron ABC transporter permease [Eggerthellaceae bacterium]